MTSPWLAATMLKRFTATTLADCANLERELAAARGLGYTVDRAEGLEGIHCVAAPILDIHGAVLAAVTIMAPVSRFPEQKFPTAGAQCSAAAREIEAPLQAWSRGCNVRPEARATRCRPA